MWKMNLFKPTTQTHRRLNSLPKSTSMPIDISSLSISEKKSPILLPHSSKKDNSSNPGYKVYISPEYGNKFETGGVLKKKINIVEGEDIRDYFLSSTERNIMLATLKFSTNYVQGFVDSKDMRLMGKFDKRLAIFKTKSEFTCETYCTICMYKFKENTRLWYLYVIVRKDKALDDPSRFDICCNLCNIKVNDIMNTYEIYPRIHIRELHYLSSEGFFSRYIFPFDFTYANQQQNRQKRLKIDDHHGDLLQIMQRLLFEYRDNDSEHVKDITLSTTGGIILKEQYDNIYVQRYRSMVTKPSSVNDVNCFMVDGKSEMLDAIQSKLFYQIKGTVFASINFCVHKSSFDGIITFPLRPDKNTYCILCKKSKMYHKNPILYCTKCGFTSKYHFKTSSHFSNLNYISKAIQTVSMHNEMILYYDINEYKNMHCYSKL
ncbi:ME53 [Lonomia obliqua multiple nucleopolyhedrovirus]|uniref:ME53 n=1 Tax=Lonomia obliqua multiple nucleopolyhedrovirus TaxID=134394 RepID=A0A126FC94_9ABAC|nr:ME53 [Lonomia obliqua multiple nucleopolyhedrovirus]AKN81021.1 ME53 [Lonomia obliqua multiple nucleopolyhedrovirus]